MNPFGEPVRFMNQLILIAIRDQALRDKIQIDLQSAGFSVRAAPGLGEPFPERSAGPMPCLALLEDPIEEKRLEESLDRLTALYPQVAIALVGSRDETARRALTYGGFAAIAPPIRREEIQLLARRADELRRARRCESLLDREAQRAIGECPIFGASHSMIRLLEKVEQVATLDTAVLIRGEPGTGKEVIARALHAQSAQRNAPFASLSASNQSVKKIEAQLLGRHRQPHRPSGPPRRGLLEDSCPGTLFIDGVFSLPLALQKTLAAAVLPKPPAGTFGIRLLASTNRRLESEVQENRFDAGLLSLLGATQLEVPPLRERPEDIPLLANHFVARACARLGRPTLPLRDDALDRLVQYSWPGNIRELKNVMEAACHRPPGDFIDADILRDYLADPPSRAAEGPLSLRHARRVAERSAIQRALAATQGNRTHAARRLDISPRSLLYKIKEFGLRD